MDGLILAAGRGSRLGELTGGRPKSLIDLGGTSPLELQIEAFAAHGVGRVVIVTGFGRELVEERALHRAGGRLDVEFAWNPFWPLTNVIGSAWLGLARIDRDFVYVHADTIFAPGILGDLIADGRSAMAIDFRAGEPEQMKALVTDGLVRHLSKTLPAEQTAGEFIGLAVFRQPDLEALHDAVEAVLGREAYDSFFEAAVNEALGAGSLAIAALPTRGRPWTEIDFAEDLALARRLLPSLLGDAR